MAFLKSNFFIKSSFSIVQKICLAGLFIALATIFQKAFVINIPVLPFFRISFGGPAIIIISSILLGPWFGFLVGAASDLLGYLIFDTKAYMPFIQITAIYALLGFVSFFVFCLIRKFSNKKLSEIILYGVLGVLFVSTTLVFSLNSSLSLGGNVYSFELWARILIPSLSLALFGLLILFIKLFDRHLNKKNVVPVFNVYQVATASLILEVVVMILFGSLMKATAFSMSLYPIILLCQIIVAFVNVPLNTAFISYIIYITRRYFKNV